MMVHSFPLWSLDGTLLNSIYYSISLINVCSKLSGLRYIEGEEMYDDVTNVLQCYYNNHK